MRSKSLTLKIILVLIFTDILETAIQFCFKKSAIPASSLHVGNFSDLLIFLTKVASSPYLWFGFIIVATVFTIWSTVLSKIDLSVAVPVASSSYIFVPIVSIIFLHEEVSLLRWLGIIFIIIGVIFVSMSSKDGEGEHTK